MADGTITLSGTFQSDNSNDVIYFYSGDVNATNYLGSAVSVSDAPSSTSGTFANYYFSTTVQVPTSTTSVNYVIQTGPSTGVGNGGIIAITPGQVQNFVGQSTNAAGTQSTPTNDTTPTAATGPGPNPNNGNEYIEAVAVGPVATAGPTGQTGPAGTNGATGPAGTNGATGQAGTNGATGPAGTNGATGATGPAGTNGTTGATGPAGTSGATGATGPAGTSGTTGATGPAGTNGTTGATGPAGTNGATGATGAAGSNGTTGATGATGTQGPTGATGPQGATGATGATGAVECFAAGTRLATRGGERRVEDLAVGDLVLTLDGGAVPVRWIGRRWLRPDAHPRPHEVRPVRIAAHAFGEGRPARDLVVSPGHGLFFQDETGEHLIPAIHLVDGQTIVQEAVTEVEYFHVELDRHEILLAEGLPAESYLDCGNRAEFENGGAAMVLHPTFAPLAHEAARAPFVIAGPLLERVRATLAARAKAADDRAIARQRRRR